MSKIEWTERTWNPVLGCTKVSPGCKNCYAIRMAWRLQHNPKMADRYKGLTYKTEGGEVNWTGVLKTDQQVMTLPLRTKKPTTWFVCSMSDLFHAGVDDNTIAMIFAIMAITPQHTYQVLTKRPDRMRNFLNNNRQNISNRVKMAIRLGWGNEDKYYHIAQLEGETLPWPLPNVWLGTSVENQTIADLRIPELLQAPAAVRFLSCEPLLGSVDLRHIHHDDIVEIDSLKGTHGVFRPHAGKNSKIDWVIAGGESGHGARPMHPDWVRSLRDQCVAAGVPFFFKQWGAWHTQAYLMGSAQRVFRQFTSFDQWVNKASTWINGGICLDKNGKQLRNGGDFMQARDEGNFPVTIMHKLVDKSQGRLLDGRTWDEMPGT